MGFKLMIFLPLLLSSIVTSQTRSVSKRYVKKTIRVKDGDVVDCVDIYKQPAFNHPTLKNHIIQMKPNYLVTRTNGTTTPSQDSKVKVPSQVWQQYGSCPHGTIPIRRQSPKNQSTYSKLIVHPNHSFSTVFTTGLSYSGAKANIKVWKPFVESTTDYSSSQVMLRTGPLKSFETAEAGWTVNPIVYNDAKTRLFAYWTVDGMKTTGCFDLTCPGFVQTAKDVLLGGDISSSYGTEITIQIHKDPETSNWWFIYNGKEVGYWPRDIFQLLRHQANLVLWGGEVYSPKVGTNPHTATAMGSGEFSDVIFSSSGTIRQMMIEANSNPLKEPNPLYVSSDEWDCYDAYLLNERKSEIKFFYGGPGSRNNPRCP